VLQQPIYISHAYVFAFIAVMKPESFKPKNFNGAVLDVEVGNHCEYCSSDKITLVFW